MLSSAAKPTMLLTVGLELGTLRTDAAFSFLLVADNVSVMACPPQN
jgi:hypothetical protein